MKVTALRAHLGVSGFINILMIKCEIALVGHLLGLTQLRAFWLLSNIFRFYIAFSLFLLLVVVRRPVDLDWIKVVSKMLLARIYAVLTDLMDSLLLLYFPVYLHRHGWSLLRGLALSLLSVKEWQFRVVWRLRSLLFAVRALADRGFNSLLGFLHIKKTQSN